MGSVGLLEQYRQAHLLAKYWTGKTIHFRNCLRQKTAGAGQTGQSGAAKPLPNPEGSREMARQTTASPQPRSSQGPLPSPKRSRGRLEKLANNEPPSPRGGRQELAGPEIAVVAGHDQGGGPHRQLPLEPGCRMGGAGMAGLESGVEQQPMGLHELHEQPPAATGGSRLELQRRGEENQVARKYSKKQAPRTSKTPIPGDFIKKYLAPSNGPANTDTPRSGESGDTIVAD